MRSACAQYTKSTNVTLWKGGFSPRKSTCARRRSASRRAGEDRLARLWQRRRKQVKIDDIWLEVIGVMAPRPRGAEVKASNRRPKNLVVAPLNASAALLKHNSYWKMK